ncbi:MAG: type II toxin-antitoxin system RelE/ParE family toxin [Candidatus Absconditabacterales bacterium]
MHNIFYTPQAQQDLVDIQHFIANDNPDISYKVIETIFFYANTLSLFPYIGKICVSGQGWREIVKPTFRYRIIYEVIWHDIRILSVFKYQNR